MPPLPSFLLTTLLTATLLGGVAAAELPLVIRVDGAPFRGALAAAESAPDASLRFTTAEGDRKLPLAELVTWGQFVESTVGVQVVLAGGGLLNADVVHTDEELLHGQSPTLGKFVVPLRLVAGVIYRLPLDRGRADQLVARVLALTGQADRVLLDNGDELSGTITAVEDATVRLTSDAGPVDLAVDKLTAVLFNPILVDKPKAAGLRAMVGLCDGGRVLATSLVTEQRTARLKLVGGGELVVPLAAIVALQSLGGRAVYLSDLQPSSYRHIPFLQLTWPYLADASVRGSRLRAGGRLTLKGLGMHSPSRITFDLDDEYRRFETLVAIDAEAGERGSVVCRVFFDDGSGKWQEQATTEIVRGGADPVALSLDLAGAKRISLLVDYADHGDELDHVDWLNARLIR